MKLVSESDKEKAILNLLNRPTVKGGLDLTHFYRSLKIKRGYLKMVLEKLVKELKVERIGAYYWRKDGTK